MVFDYKRDFRSRQILFIVAAGLVLLWTLRGEDRLACDCELRSKELPEGATPLSYVDGEITTSVQGSSLKSISSSALTSSPETRPSSAPTLPTPSPTIAPNSLTSSAFANLSFPQRIRKVHPKLRRAFIDKCLKTPVTEFTAFDCEEDITDTSIYPDFLNSTKRNPLHSEWRYRNVTYMRDTGWGGTCNRMEIIAGAMYSMLTNTDFPESSTNMLALGSILSEVAWQMDWKMMTRDFPVLLECTECHKDDKTKILHCGYVIVDGNIINIGHEGVFFIQNEYIDFPMYWWKGPSEVGFHPVLAYYLLPRNRIRRAVEKGFERHRQKSKAPLLGVHRRNMDASCYRFYADALREVECYKNGPSQAAVYDILMHANLWGRMEEKNFDFKTIENEFPWLSLCNLTWDEEQLEIFKREWPYVLRARDKYDILMASDGNDAAGDNLFLSNSVVDNVYRTSDWVTELQCSNAPHRGMLYDMWSLVLSDYHLTNPLSSCDVIVVHWRRVLGERESG